MLLLGIAIFIVIFVVGSMPECLLPLITNQDERAGVYKSMILKSEFGIVSEKEKLLSFDPEKDQEFEDIESGHFGAIYRKLGKDCLDMLNRLQKSLPERSRLRPFYPPTWEQISLRLQPMTVLMWEGRFSPIERNMNRIKKILKRCIELKYSNLCDLGNYEYKMHLFPYYKSNCNRFFAVNKPRNQTPPRQFSPIQYRSPWENKIHQTLTTLGNLGNTVLPANLKIYADRIKNKATPARLLDVQKGVTVRKAWRQAAVKVAPDKNPEFPKEAAAIFDCLKTAYDTLSA